MVAQRDQPLERARALAREALGAWRGADPDHAIDACDHALALLLPVGPSDALADVLRWKGSVFRDRGNHAAAADLYAQSLTVADSIGYRGGRAHALNCLGTIAQFRGDLDAAERWYGEAARLAHRLGDRRLSGMVQQNLGIVADMQGRMDEAVAHFRLALAAFEQEEERDAVLWVLNNLGVLYTREAAYVRATDVLDRALDIANVLSDVASEAIVEENRSALFLATGKLEQAEAAATRALGIAAQRRDNTRRAAAFRMLARVTRVRQQGAQHAVTLLERALALCQLGEDVQLRVEILSDLGDACRDAGDLARAKECWRRALEVCRLAGFAGLIGGLQGRLRPAPVDRSDGVSEVVIQ
jgi:tetratricopeptide (TPR) repeat protein